MNRRLSIFSGIAALALAGVGAGALWKRRQAGGPPPLPQMPQADFAAALPPLPRPQGPLRVFHLGHSLVGRNMPAMLAQLVEGHRYASQLGWGATLRQHWLGAAEVPGFDQENAHPAFAEAKQAIGSGDYDAIVLTEMVELKDAIKWHSSSHYLAEWGRLARQARPDVRLYLYETWHNLDDPAGWLQRIDADAALWRDELVRRAMSDPAVGPIYRLPGGPAMAAVARAAEAGEIPGLDRREALFSLTPEGAQDTIHFSDLGAYVIALTHFAVLYQQDPQGLPHRLRRADGTMADAFADEAAPLVQRIVWQLVQGDPLTGVAI